MSWSVTLYAYLATLSISVRSGSATSALSKAARRWACDALPSPSRIRATNALRACVISDMPIPCLRRSGAGRAGERLEEATPVASAVEDGPHLITTCPVAVKVPMFQLDTRTAVALGDEAHLDFRFEGRVGLPVGADVPGEDQARVRFPRKYAAPVARASIVTALVPAAPYPRLDHGVHRVGLADLVGRQRP